MLESISKMRIWEIETRYVNGFAEYMPDRWGVGFRVLAGFTYGGWLGVNMALGPLRVDLELAHDA